MKRILSVIIALAIVLSAFTNVMINVVANSEATDGTTYYVDSENGNDNNSGTEKSKAWQSLENVNKTTFQPGDSILLKRDSVWTGTYLWPKGSGTEDNAITVSSYGEGSLPVIKSLFSDEMDSLPPADACVYLENQSYVTIENLYIVNGTDGTGTQYGIKVNQKSSYRTFGIIIKNCVVQGSSLKNWSTVSKKGLTGIGVSSDSYNGYVGSITIENNEIYNCKDIGISVNGAVSGCNQYGVVNQKSATNVVIRGNYLSNIGADGIIVNNCVNPLVEFNTVNNSHSYSGAYHVAIWAFACYNAVFQYNEAYNTKTTSDGQGYDCDYQSYYTTFQYNYSHDNAGGFMLICTEPKNWDGGVAFNVGSIVRYNVSQNDRHRVFSLTGHIKDTKIYNNTIYSKWASASNLIYAYSRNGVYANNTEFTNNIFYIESASFIWENCTETIFENNLIYGRLAYNAPQNGVSSDKFTANANIYYKDPMFVDAGGASLGLDSCDAYYLYDNSPAIGAGKIIDDELQVDFFGNPISKSQAPNIGAYNGSGIPYVDKRPLYSQRYRTIVDWETASLKSTDNNVPNVFSGDTTTWLSTVSVVNDKDVLNTITGSTKGIAIHNNGSQQRSCAVHVYIPSGLLEESKGIRIWAHGNGKSMSSKFRFYGTSMEKSTSIPANGGWVNINWDDQFYNYSIYKNEIGTDEIMRKASSVLISFQLPGDATVYLDDIQIDLSNEEDVKETTSSNPDVLTFKAQQCEYTGDGTITTNSNLNDAGSAGKTFLVLDGQDNSAVKGHFIELTIPSLEMGSYLLTTYTRDYETRSNFNITANGFDLGEFDFSSSLGYSWSDRGIFTLAADGDAKIRFTITQPGLTGLYLDKVVLTKVETPQTTTITETATTAVTTTVKPTITQPTTAQITIIYGDVNNDKIVNAKDVLQLRKYVAHWGVEINEEAADVNNDKEISSKDVLLLRKYLAHWDVKLG